MIKFNGKLWNSQGMIDYHSDAKQGPQIYPTFQPIYECSNFMKTK